MSDRVLVPMPIILPWKGIEPRLAPGVFVAPNATLIGDIEIAEGGSVWFGCVLRGDEQAIRIGPNSNIQDLTLIHTTRGGPDATIGANVTVGHSAIIHGCTIHDDVLIGMGAIVLDGAVIESGALIAAGAVVSPGKRVRAGELWAGCPATRVGEVTESHKAMIALTPPLYAERGRMYGEVLRKAEGSGE